MNKNFKKSFGVIVIFFMLFSNLNPFLYYTKAQEILQESSFIEKNINDIQLDHVPWEVLVKFKKSSVNLKTQDWLLSAESIMNSKSVDIVENVPDNNISVISVSTWDDINNVINTLESDPNVEFAQPNYLYYPEITPPSDGDFYKLWWLNNDWQLVTWEHVNGYFINSWGVAWSDIKWLEAMDVFSWVSDPNITWVVVAVIDEWVAYSHPDLVSQMWDGSSCFDYSWNVLGGCIHGYDFLDDDKDPMATIWSHWTHVAWTIASAINSFGSVWVNPKAKIMAIKAWNGSFTTSNIIKSINFAKYNWAKIINASLWSLKSSYSAAYDEAFYQAIAQFPWLFIAAAWNDWQNLSSIAVHRPSDYSKTTPYWTWLNNMISVAATDQSDQMANFSNHSASMVDIAAPWVNIYSNVLNFLSTWYTNDFQTYQIWTIWDFISGWLTTWEWNMFDLWNWNVVLATNNLFSGSYDSWLNTYVETQPINILYNSWISLDFDAWCQSEYTPSSWSDYVSVFVSTWTVFNNVWNFDYATPELGKQKIINWFTWYEWTISFDISKYISANTKIRFQWNTNSILNNYAWCYIDNLRVVNLDGWINGKSMFYNWTSMATPHVAWLASLAWSFKPNFSLNQIKDAILTWWDYITWLQVVTSKRINAYKTLCILAWNWCDNLQQQITWSSLLPKFSFITWDSNISYLSTWYTVLANFSWDTIDTWTILTVLLWTWANVFSGTSALQNWQTGLSLVLDFWSWFYYYTWNFIPLQLQLLSSWFLIWDTINYNISFLSYTWSLSSGWSSNGPNTWTPSTMLNQWFGAIFSNSWAISSGWYITINLTNNRMTNLTWIIWIWFSVSKKFNTDNISFTWFSLWLVWNSCTWNIQSINVSDTEKWFACTLSSPINLNIWSWLSFIVSWVVNPISAWKYNIWVMLKKSDYDEFFWNQIKISDLNDNTAPTTSIVLPISKEQIAIKFNEPIDISYSTMGPSVDIRLFSGMTQIPLYSINDDYETHTKLFISMPEQVPWKTYTLVFSGLKDMNGNLANNFTVLFSWYDASAKWIDKIIPIDFLRWENNFLVDIFGKNWLFSWVAVYNIIPNFGSWISYTGLSIVDSNHIKLYTNIASNLDIGIRDFSILVWWTQYNLFNAFNISKNTKNLVIYQWVTTKYDPQNQSWIVQVKFDSNISWITTWNINLQKIFGTWSVPTITSVRTSDSGTNLIVSLNWVYSGSYYELSFSWVVASNSKVIDDNLKIWFDFNVWWQVFWTNQILPPIVMKSNPWDWSKEVPVSDENSTWFTIKVYFDQNLQSDTITTTNIVLKDDLNTSVPWTLSYTWVNGEYFITYTTNNNLDYWKFYTLSLSNNVKSEKWIWLVWNVPDSEGKWHKIRFNTKFNYANSSITFGSWAYKFNIENTYPFFWQENLPYDAKLQLTFNDIIDKSSIITWSVVLKRIDSNVNILSSVDVPLSNITYDSSTSPKIVYINQSMSQWYKYRLMIKNNIKSTKQIMLDGNNQFWYFVVEFKTSSQTSSQQSLNMMWDYFKPDLSRIEVGFSTPLDISTINTSNIALYLSWWAKQSINVGYDSKSNMVFIEPTSQLSNGSNYILYFWTWFKSIWWLSISSLNLPEWFSSSNWIVSKSYSVSSVWSDIHVTNFFATSDKLELSFSKAIKDPTSKSNYTLRYVQNFDTSAWIAPENAQWYVTYSISNALLDYDSQTNKITISGIEIPSSSTWTTVLEVKLNNIQDSYGNELASDCSYSTWCIGIDLFHMPIFTQSVKQTFQASNVAIELHANVTPQNNIAWKNSLYFIDFPISKRLSSGSTVEILFPDQFDISNAYLDTNSPVNYVNWVISESTKKFTISKDSRKNALIYTIRQAYNLNDNDYIISDIKWIINPTQAKDFSTDWYLVEITTKNNQWMILDKFTSNPIYIKSAPTASLSKTITIQFTWTNITLSSLSGAVIRVNSSEWYTEIYSNQNGQAIFTWTQNSFYNIFVDPTVVLYNAGNYSASSFISEWKPYDINLNDNKTLTIRLKSTNDSSLSTIAWTINWLNNKKVTVWISSQKWYFEKELWTLWSNSVSYNIKVPNNLWLSNIGIKPTLAKDYQTSSTSIALDWQPPLPKNIDLTWNSLSWIDFNIVSADKTFTVVVSNQSGSAIPNAKVFVYSPSWKSMWLYWETDINWQKTFNISQWVYTYWAYVEWLPNIPEKTIVIGSTASSFTGNLVVKLSTLTIKWKVLKWTDPVSNVSMYAFNQSNWKWLNTMTDKNWNYTFYVENWDWKVWGWVPWYWPLTESTYTVSSVSLENKNFSIDSANIYSFTWSVKLWSVSWTWIDWVNIFAEPTDWDYTKGWFAFTDKDWNYTLNLKNWWYKVKSFSPQYGFIWEKNITVSSASWSINTFIVEIPKTVTINLTWAWLPSDINGFEWFIDVFDQTTKKWFNKKISSQIISTFDNVWAWTYWLKVFVPWRWEVYSSWAFVVNSDRTLDVNLDALNKLVSINWIVKDGSWTALLDAFVEFKNIDTKQFVWVKTTSTWYFETKLSSWVYQIIAKKPDYLFSGNVLQMSVWQNWLSLTWDQLILNKIQAWVGFVTISWSVTSSTWLNLANSAFVSLEWVDWSWNVNGKWFGQTVNTDSLFWFIVPSGERWKLKISSDWHDSYDFVFNGVISSNYNSWFTLQYNSSKITQLNNFPITPSQGWIVSDTNVWLELTLPAAALWDGSQPWTLKTNETFTLPLDSTKQAIWWSAVEITATDSNGNPITNLTTDVSISLTYTGWELISTNSWISISDIRNLQVSYYDSSASSWISLPTIVSITWIDNFDLLTGGQLIRDTTWSGNLIVTLKTTTNHFTLFTSIVSSIVSNSTSSNSSSSSNSNSNSWNSWWLSWGSSWGGSWWWASIIAWVAQTVINVSKYIWNVEQSIKLVAWSNLDQVLTIQRNWKSVKLTDIISSAWKTISNVWQNLVSFAVWDIIKTSTKWSIELALNGYTKANLQPWASLKISEVSSSLLSYENLEWKIKYEFDKQKNANFKYQVKWKVSYATIRWTTLEVSSEKDKDVYNLIEWKVDVYNSTKKTTVSMNAWDKYIAYANWNDELIKSNSNSVFPNQLVQNSTTNSSNSSTSNVQQNSTVWISGVDKESVDAAIKLKEKWITKLSPENTSFYSNLTRWELSLLVWRYAEKIFSKTQSGGCKFSDISALDTITQSEILKSCKLWLFKWANGKFSPLNNATRWQVIMVIARLLNNKSDMELDDSYDYMLNKQIIKVDDRKSSGRSVSRYEIYLMLYRIIQKYNK